MLTTTRLISAVNKCFALLIFIVSINSLSLLLFSAFLVYFILAFSERIDILFTILFFHINYTFSFLILHISPENYMFSSVAAMGNNLFLVYFYLTIILLFIILCLYLVPVRGVFNYPQLSKIFKVLKITIVLNSIPSIFGLYGVGRMVASAFIGYFIRIFLILQILLPLLFTPSFSKWRYFYLSLIAIAGFISGSRAFIFIILLNLFYYGLIHNVKINFKAFILGILLIGVSVYFYPIISANRLGQEFTYSGPIGTSTLETILSVRQRFGGVDIANGLYNSGFKFPWYQLYGEMGITLNKYFPGDFLPLPPNFYPSEYISAKLLSDYDFLHYIKDEFRYTESMRLGRFFLIGPLSIIFLFLTFLFSLYIQNNSKEVNYIIRFNIIYNMLLAGSYSETFYITLDMVFLNIILMIAFKFQSYSSDQRLQFNH